jgi:hypothetical protein
MISDWAFPTVAAYQPAEPLNPFRIAISTPRLKPKDIP